MNDPIPLPPIPAQIPPSLSRLWELAHNLWWSWNPSARGLFKFVDRTLWRTTNHSPVKLLAQCRPETLETMAGGEMTEFMRLGGHDIFSGIEIIGGKTKLSAAPGFGIHVDKKKLIAAASKNNF